VFLKYEIGLDKDGLVSKELAELKRALAENKRLRFPDEMRPK
jgi:hypothetical protein